MSEIFPVILAACLVNNLVLENLLGVSAVHAVSRTLDTAGGMALAMLIVLPVTTTSCHLAHNFLLVPAKMEFLRLPLFVTLVVVSVYALKAVLERLRPSILARLEVFFPLMLANSSLLGAALLVLENSPGLFASLLQSIGTALGFGIVLVLFSSLRSKLAQADIPTAFEGPAILLVTLGILSMAFMGLSGLRL